MVCTVKRKTLIFLFAIFLNLLMVPMVNIISAYNRDVTIKWNERSFLYNMDFFSRWVARLVYPFGISTDPTQVIIGYDDWLFLGDFHGKTRTVDRQAPSEEDFVRGKQIGAAIEAWDAYLANRGVKLFRIMVGPNKGTIYPEYLPNWARTATPNATDALLVGTGTERYVDLRKPLLAAKAADSATLYYKTDTHWNAFGAGVAFRAFAQQVGPAAPELRWPAETTYEVSRIAPRLGGDLARFLRLQANLTDSEPITKISNLSIDITQLDFETKEILHQDGNPLLQAASKPLLVKSPNALNNKRVLWLRDSFGNAMSPLMAATFTDVLQLHWVEGLKSTERFVSLIEEFKPDYIFVTVVERFSKSDAFTIYPPLTISDNLNSFKSIRNSEQKEVNQVIKNGEGEYQINGTDPFVDFLFSGVVNPAETPYLNFNIACEDGTVSVPLQLFWLENGLPYFDELHSIRFIAKTGKNFIDLRTIPKIVLTNSISRIRLDIDAKNSCAKFKLNNPSIGRI